MAANNVKIAFRLPSGVNEDFIRNLIWQHQQQQQHQKISTFTSGFSKYTREKICAEKIRSSACSFIKKETLTQAFSCEIVMNTFFIEHPRTTDSGRAQDFTKNGPNSNS